MVLISVLWSGVPVSPAAGENLSGTRSATVGVELPRARWDHLPQSQDWTGAAMAALKQHGTALPGAVPRDIAQWCPAYPQAEAAKRRAFWVGFLSVLARHESTYKPAAVGGGGKWFGLLQISPATARGYGCRARSGAALKDGGDNLSCAVRIMAVTVPRDGVLAVKQDRWRGVAADWGPMRSPDKQADMKQWLSSQSYCQRTTSPRPKANPNPNRGALPDR